MTSSQRFVVWSKEGGALECVDVTFEADRLTAEGTTIAMSPRPYRLDYRLETFAGYRTSRLHVTTRGDGWEHALDLRADGNGNWDVAGDGDAASLEGALHCDLGESPLTNTLPLLAHDIRSPGATRDI